MSLIRVNTSKSQRGQISVFLALGFLVLFTMFAMTVNVAMVVHDKINLQNAADFASIYVAQRQAEMLNAIAHTNYQIRQAHKLLAYRYVVLGTAGIAGSQAGQGESSDEGAPDPFAVKENFPFCIADNKILNFPNGTSDNYCGSNLINILGGGGFGGINALPVSNPYQSSNYALRAFTQGLQAEIQTGFGFASAVNWYFVNNFLSAYRYQISYKKAVIKALARNLMRPIVAGQGGMLDLYGQPVFEGARKTFEYNLSESSRRVGGFDIQIFNSLEGVGPDERVWLPQIATYITPVYIDFIASGASGAVPEIRYYHVQPSMYGDPTTRNRIDSNLLSSADPTNVVMDLSFTDFPEGDNFEEILGFEKNPWYMVYNRVQAQTTSGALFAPTPNVVLQAQAFSKPFGGRIGPWYGRDWPSGSDTSSSNKVEPLWPDRKVGTSRSTDPRDPMFLPNAPKYPGDRIGFKSRLAQSSTNRLGVNNSDFNSKFSINDYTGITYELIPGRNGQALPVDGSARMRQRELAILAPDLFDITYYSIETNFHENYLEGKLDSWLPQELVFSGGVLSYQGDIWRDWGFQSDDPDLATFNVRRQFETPERGSGYAARMFYFLENTPDFIANVLTSWVGGIDVGLYRTPADSQVRDRFGRCGAVYSSGGNGPNIPGECLDGGGRTGYSVKMVSREYLMSSEHRMSPSSTGPIRNPPQGN